jgi:hypothetical protein
LDGDDQETAKRNQVLEETDELLETVGARVLNNHFSEPWYEPDNKSIGRPLRNVWPRPATPPFDFNKDNATHAIDDAEHRDYTLLAKHLRDGTACREEMYVAAEILEGRVPPKGRGKPKRPSTIRRYIDIYFFVQRQFREHGSMEAAVVEAALEKFGITTQQVYAAVKVIKDAEREMAEEAWQDYQEEQWREDNSG